MTGRGAGNEAGLARLSARRRLGLALTIAVLALFYGLVLVMAFLPDLLGAGAPFSLGYALVLAVILAVIGLAIYYMRKTRAEFRDLETDPLEARE